MQRCWAKRLKPAAFLCTGHSSTSCRKRNFSHEHLKISKLFPACSNVRGESKEDARCRSISQKVRGCPVRYLAENTSERPLRLPVSTAPAPPQSPLEAPPVTQLLIFNPRSHIGFEITSDHHWTFFIPIPSRKKPYNLNPRLITSESPQRWCCQATEGTLPYPTLPYPTNKTITSIKWSHPHSPGLVAQCTKFKFVYRFESKFQNCWKNQSDASEINGHQCYGQAWSDITFQRFKKNSKLYFATPNKESNIL